MKRIILLIEKIAIILMMAYIGVLTGSWSEGHFNMWLVAYFVTMLFNSSMLVIGTYKLRLGVGKGMSVMGTAFTVELALFTYTSGFWCLKAVIGGLVAGTSIIYLATRSKEE